MKQKLKVGIAGYGVVGKKRRHFIDIHPQLETVAVCDQVFSDSGAKKRMPVEIHALLQQTLVRTRAFPAEYLSDDAAIVIIGNE